MKLLTVLALSVFALSAQAGVQAFSGTAGEKLYIEAAPKLGADAHIVKFEGPASAWAGKPILVKHQERPSANRYVIEYKKKIGTGTRTKDEQYQMVIENGFELINVSIPE